ASRPRPAEVIFREEIADAHRGIRAQAFDVRDRCCNGTLIQHTQETRRIIMTIKRVTVKKNERGLLLRNGDFERVLQPGTHWLFAGFDVLRVERFALEQPAFTHALAEYLMAKEPDVVAAEFVRVELGENQVGLRTENGTLVEVLAPATRRLYWKGLVDVQVEVIDIAASAEVPPAL